MRKIQEFMKNRCGIDELNLFFLCLGLLFYFVYVFLPEEKKIWACLGCLIFVVLSVYRVFSENLEWRKKENQVFVRFYSFFIPERKETEEEKAERKKERLEKKKRNKELREKSMRKVEEVREETKKAEKEPEEKSVVLEEEKEDRNEIERKRQEEIARQREEQREKEQREREEQKKKEEEKRAAEALAREQKKREQRKREQKFDPNYVYFNCPYCNQAIRIPKRQGKVKITCPTCKNKFIKET